MTAFPPAAVPEPPAQLASANDLRAQIESLAAQAAAIPIQPPEPASYGILAAPRETFRSLVSTIQSLLESLKPEAEVRTTVNGASARTVLNYSGRAITVVPRDLSPALAQTHLASLQQTFALRAAVIGALSAAASATLALSLTAANPLYLPRALSTAISLKAALIRLAAIVQTTAPTTLPTAS
jgi:hypothetical protein